MLWKILLWTWFHFEFCLLCLDWYPCRCYVYRLQELRADLTETKQARSQLEQVTYALSEELRSLRNKVEGQQAEFVNMVTDVRNRARKLEDENRIHVRYQNLHCTFHIGPRQANLVLIAYASREGSGEPAHLRSLARTSAARSYKQWVKRNLQTKSQIPSPSEWLGMRNYHLSWRNARRHKFAWRGSYYCFCFIHFLLNSMVIILVFRDLDWWNNLSYDVASESVI